MTLSDILGRLDSVKGSGSKYTARCPAHEDGHNSLAVAQGDKGIVIHCHAGCDKERVLALLGVSMQDLFNEKQIPPTRANGKREVEKVYDYVDADGKLIHQTLRYQNKQFSQRRPDPTKPGQWIYSLKDIQPVIYNLPAVLDAVQGKKPVYICEGEKDCDTLIAKKLVATTCPMGAGKWRDYFSEWLVGAYVYILPDNDTAGKNHAQAIAKSLYGKAKSIKICDLAKEAPNFPDKGDVTDFISMFPPDEQSGKFGMMLKNALEYTEDVATSNKTGLVRLSNITPQEVTWL